MLLLFGIFRVFHLDLASLKQVKVRHYIFIFSGVLFFSLNIFFEFLRYFVLMKSLSSPPTLKEIISSHFIGYTLGFVTPGSIGTLGKGFFFQNHGKISPSAIVTMDKMIGMLSTYLGGFISLLILSAFFNLELPVKSDLISLAAMVMILIFLWMIFLPGKVLSVLERFLPEQSKIKTITLQFRQTFHNIQKKTIFISMIISILWIVIITFEYHSFISVFGVADLHYSILFIPLMLMLKLLAPIAVGDLGLREGILIYLYGLISFPAEFVLAGSLLIFLLNVVFPALLGLIFLRIYKVD